MSGVNEYEETLPCDVLQCIMEYSDPNEVPSQGLVRSSWYSSARRDELWRQIAIREFDFPRKGEQQRWKQWYATMKVLKTGWERGASSNFKMQPLRGHKSFVTSIDMTASILLSSSDDSTIRLWKTTETGTYTPSGTIQQEYGIHRAQQAFDDDVIIGSNYNGDVFAYNIKTDVETTTLPFSNQFDSLFNYDSDEKILTTANDKILTVWDVSRNVNILNIDLPETATYIHSQFDKKQQITVGSSNKSFIFDIRGTTNNKIIHTIDSGIGSTATSHYWKPENDSFIIGRQDGTVDMYNTKSGDHEAGFTLNNSITSIKRTDRYVAAGDVSGSISLVQFSGGGDCEIKKIQYLTGHNKAINDLSMNDSKILSASADGTTMVHKISNKCSQLYALLGGSLTPNARNPPNPRKPFASAVRFNDERVVIAWNSLVRSYNFSIPASKLTSDFSEG